MTEKTGSTITDRDPVMEAVCVMWQCAMFSPVFEHEHESGVNRKRIVLDELTRLRAQVAALDADLELAFAVNEAIGNTLTRTANALKGEPAEGTLHSTADLPELVTELRA